MTKVFMKAFDSARPHGPSLPDGQFHSLVEDRSGLTVNLKKPLDDDLVWSANFQFPTSYRASDEGVLLAYWNDAMQGGNESLWELFESEYQSWLGVVSFGMHPLDRPVRHFLIVTDFQCVEVLTETEPTVVVFD